MTRASEEDPAAGGAAIAGASAAEQEQRTSGYTETDWGRINNEALPDQDPFETADLRQLYWIPEPPESANMPELAAVWEKLRQNVTTYSMVETESEPTEGNETDSDPDAAPSLRQNRRARSPNWSGTWVDSVGGRHFTTIAGHWTTPTARRPDTVGTNRHCRSSIWVGLDGQGSYANASLPQIGVSQDLPRGATVAENLPWFEWWATKGDPRRPRPPKGTFPRYIATSILAVAPSDEIICWIDIIPRDADFPANMARMMIKNETQRILVLPFIVYPPNIGTQANPRYPRVAGATAEWIVERPAKYNLKKQFVMPRFESDLSFHACVAASLDVSGQAQEHTLTVSQQIALFQATDGRRRTELIALPGRPSTEKSFSIEVRGS